MQTKIPQIKGIANPKTAHFQLPDSFLIVIKVVLHGKCNSEKIITLIAVKIVQPFATKISPILSIFSMFISSPFDK